MSSPIVAKPRLFSTRETFAGWIGLVFISLFSLIWITLFSFNPSFVQVIEFGCIFPEPGAHPDPIKCFMYSFLIALVFTIASWIISIQARKAAIEI